MTLVAREMNENIKAETVLSFYSVKMLLYVEV